MAKRTWTDRIWAMKPGDSLSDPTCPGLRFRARKGGVYGEARYKVGPGKWQAVPLGRFPTREEHEIAERRALDRGEERPNPYGELRIRAMELQAQARAGHDPRGGQSPDSLGAIAQRFMRHAVADNRPRTQTERKRHLERDWAPLHDCPAGQITHREIAEHLLTLKERHGVVAANRSRGTLRAMFAWAMAQGLVDDNPVARTGKVGKEASRERVLSMAELRAIWDEARDGDHGPIVRLLMLTGQRREEVGGMRWSELDLDRALWSLPGARTKNGKPHQVPLSSQAVELLRGVEQRPGRDNVFGNGAGSFSGWSRSKRRLDGRAKVADWRLHDLRRSWATHVNELIGAPHVVEAAINHLSGHKGGVAGIYNRAQYWPERVRAMQLWADHLLQSEPAKVVQLRA